MGPTTLIKQAQKTNKQTNKQKKQDSGNTLSALEDHNHVFCD